MSTDLERLQQLEASYRKLWNEHTALKDAIKENYAEFKLLRDKMGVPAAETEQPPIAASSSIPVEEPKSVIREQVIRQTVPAAQLAVKKPAEKSSWEQYIGEQLLSKIGIAILVIGVGIGAKYAIDHQILTPAMRIAGGYVVAALLGFFAYRFKEKYESFSAVLVSGSMAVCYFMTYAGFSFYHLFPYSVAFALLLITTIATVYAAIRYNQVVIAHIGLVGAFVLPALIAQRPTHLSNYLAYMAVINGGILFISFLRDWKSLYYVAFGWTSLVFIVWFFTSYNETADSTVALIYASAYFVLFHTTAVAYPLLKKQSFLGKDIVLILPNVLVYLGIGNYILYAAPSGEHASSIFVFLISLAFFGLWAIFRQVRKADELLHQTHLVTGLSVLTLALILELDGAGLVFAMVLEAVVLTWLGLKSNWKSLDIFSVILLSVAALCFIFAIRNDGFVRSSEPFTSQPFFVLLATVFAALGGYLYFRRTFPDKATSFAAARGMIVFFLVGFFVILFTEILMAFRLEQLNYLQKTKMTALCETAMVALYWLGLVKLNTAYFRFKNDSKWVEIVSIVVVGVTLLATTIVSQLTTNAFDPENYTGLYLLMRYVIIGSLLVLLISWIRSNASNALLVTVFHICLLWILSLEMTHWLAASGNRNAYKLSLSILWGAYATYILFTGIKRNIPALRVTAMVILGITLVKLFFYDIVRLSTISKTIVFIALGGLMLVGAYFYQRYKKTEEQAEEEKTDTSL